MTIQESEAVRSDVSAHAYVSAAPRLELRCESCGYGVVVRVRPPFCPMCGGHGWEYAAWRPFSARPPQRIA